MVLMNFFNAKKKVIEIYIWIFNNADTYQNGRQREIERERAWSVNLDTWARAKSIDWNEINWWFGMDGRALLCWLCAVFMCTWIPCGPILNRDVTLRSIMCTNAAFEAKCVHRKREREQWSLNKSKSNINAIDANNDMEKIEDTRSSRKRRRTIAHKNRRPQFKSTTNKIKRNEMKKKRTHNTIGTIWTT